MNVLCLKLRARKTWAPPPAAPKVVCNAPRHLITKCLWREKPDKMSPPLQITEDTPPDMLAGSMDLCVMLPNGHTVKMSVERSTPMMDLLVQVTTANKISPAGHTIQALGERGVMPYKPSTPIGALDTWTINIVPKNQTGQSTNRKAPLKPVNQPFEQTFRLQVHLPRNQLYVTRISPKTKLSDILTQVCNEKNLDSSKYSLRHPAKLDQVLNLLYCLADYKLTEVALVSNRSWPLGVSSVDIMSLQQTDNFNMSRNNRSCEGSMSSGSIGGRSLSPTRSDGSSASPPPVVQPNRPLRKRRPAPKPPVAANNNINNNINNCNNSNTIDNNSNKCEQSSSQEPQNTVICHSRNSSDSSGYHEASVLSESPESNSLPDSLPRRSKLPSASIAESSSSKVASNLSRSLSNLTAVGNSRVPTMKTHSVSSTSLVSITGRKKKAAPPPPPLLSKMSSVSEESPKQRTSSISSNASSSATLEENDHNLPRKASTLPASIRVAQSSSKLEPSVPDLCQNSSVVNDTPCSMLDRLQDPPVELPKPKPRTVFRTDSVTSINSTKSVGDGSETTNSSVNRILPRKSKKSYHAPAPKPRSYVTSENTTNLDNFTKNDSSQNQVINDIVNKDEDKFDNEENLKTKEIVLQERRFISRTMSIDDAILMKSSDVLPSSDIDSTSITSSTSSVFIKTDVPENVKKLKEFPSETSLVEKVDSNRERNFSVGNLEDVPAFLSKSPQLGRWKNMECLAEACPDACRTDCDSVLETEQVKNPEPAPEELRLDDDEIDRIFHNATRDHTSLESGVGEEPPLSLLSLPSPPSSLSNQPEESSANNPESLYWEYKLPAPPTFRDETNSPTVTEFDTVTIGNLTEVFGPDSVVQNEFKTKNVKKEPDVLNSQVVNTKSIANETTEIVSQREEDKLVITKNIRNVSMEIEKEKDNKMKERSVKKSVSARHGSINSGCPKPDLLSHSSIEEEEITTPEAEKTAVINELSSVISERLNKPEVKLTDIEHFVKTKNAPDVQQSSALDNFVITTYKETKPIEVFEDDSIKSSNREKRDCSRDEAMFRAPKSVTRRFEPNLTRRSSFNSDDKPTNVTVKRSVSHVSLLAGNVSRGPYRSHLARSNGALAEVAQLPEETRNDGPRLRKTTSELNISQGTGNSKIPDWRTSDSVGLQSLQVLRSILPQLNHSQGCVDSVGNSENKVKDERVPPVSNKKFECTLSEQKEEPPSKEFTPAKRYSYCGPPSINLTTWSERPKRQVSIKMDRDYYSGFGKLKSNSLDETETKDSTKSNELMNGYSTMLVQQSQSKLDEKPDIIKSSSDLSRVPIVRAVEFKKPFSATNIDTTDFSRCGYFNGRSYENLSYLENDYRQQSINKPDLQSMTSSSSSSTSSSSYKSSVLNSSRSNVNLNTQQTEVDEERTSSVTSLAKRFGQSKPRPSSCYLFSTQEIRQEKEAEKNEDYYVKPANTSRVFLNSSDKKFTSIVGINGVESNNHSISSNNNINNGNNKTEIKIVQKPQFQTSKVMIGGKNPDSFKTVGFKVNGNIYNNNNNNNKVDNSTASDVRAQSRIRSGGFVEDNTKTSSYGSKISHNPSLRQNNSVMPVVKGFRQIVSKATTDEQSAIGGIPPPPPVMPVLKPVGERRQIKTLPPPQADPRDQLLESIRNFGGANSLKKVASK